MQSKESETITCCIGTWEDSANHLNKHDTDHANEIGDKQVEKETTCITLQACEPIESDRKHEISDRDHRKIRDDVSKCICCRSIHSFRSTRMLVCEKEELKSTFLVKGCITCLSR